MSDCVLILGSEQKALSKFLQKMGCEIIESESGSVVEELSQRRVVDLVVADSSLDLSANDLCSFVRTLNMTRKVPLVIVSKDEQEAESLRDLRDEQLEVVVGPCSVGVIASRVVTQLRLRKIAGGSDAATLSEMNAALRDLNDRLNKDLNEARDIQRGLLPEKLPKNDLFEIVAHYQPLQEVGGDWYFVEQHEDNSVSLQISDVTGHGLSAAFVGSMTKLAMVAANRKAPHEKLAEMNRLMAPQIPEGRFVTMASACYDPDTGKLRVSCAGHPPVVIVRATGKQEKIGGEGFPLGFFDGSEYTLGEATLEPGDIAFMLTDGITEAQNRSGTMYGTDRLVECLSSWDRSSGLQAVLDLVLKDFNTFRDGRLLKDDVTIVVLTRLM